MYYEFIALRRLRIESLLTSWQQCKFIKCCVIVQGAVDNDMLRHLASEVGDEWRRLAKSLGIRPVRQLAIIRSSESVPGSESRRDAVYDMLTSWMKKMPRAANKVCMHVTLLIQVDSATFKPKIAVLYQVLNKQVPVPVPVSSTTRLITSL